MSSFPRAGEDKPSPRRSAAVNWGSALRAISATARGRRARWWALLGLHWGFMLFPLFCSLIPNVLKWDLCSLLLLKHQENQHRPSSLRNSVTRCPYSPWPGQQPPSLVTAQKPHLVSSHQLVFPIFMTPFIPWGSPSVTLSERPATTLAPHAPVLVICFHSNVTSTDSWASSPGMPAFSVATHSPG